MKFACHFSISILTQFFFSSHGTLNEIPVPRPRKTKLNSLTTSLQNVYDPPVPAPRSITPSGSTMKLNDSTNPFADDMDEEDLEDSSFMASPRRNTVTYSSLNHHGGSFSRNDIVTRSLTPAAKGRRKKRLAPLPPSSTGTLIPKVRKAKYQTDPSFILLCRFQSSKSDSSKTSPGSTRSYRIPPPRPPLPKQFKNI